MRRSMGVLATVALLLTMVVASLALVARDTQAVHIGGHFELGDPPPDANILGDGNNATGPDWADLFDSGGNVIGGALAKFGGLEAVFIADELSVASQTDVTVFAESNKNNDLVATWNWDTGNVPAKDDLSNVYSYATLNGDGDLLIYAGLERLAPNGDSHIDIEYNAQGIGLDKAPPCGDDGVAPPVVDPQEDDGSPCEFVNEKSEDDFVLSVDFTNGGAFGSMEVRRWDGATYVPIVTLAGEGCNAVFNGTPADVICAFSNDITIDGGPWPNYDNHSREDNPATHVTELKTNAFTEVGINVTEILGETPCLGSINFHTRSSQSFTAELKDFALAPFSICGDINAHKYHDLNHNGVDDGEPALAGWTIFIDENSNEVLDGAEVSAVTDSGGNVVFPALLPGTYSVCEQISDQLGGPNTPPDWINTDPGGTTLCESVTHGFGAKSSVDFGNFLPPDVTVNKKAKESKINSGETAGINITVSNIGPGDAQGVTLNDTLPAGLSWNEKPDTAECTITSGKLDCDIGELLSKASFDVSLEALTDGEDCGTHENEATVAATNEQTAQQGNNTDSTLFEVNCPDLKIVKTPDAGVISAGETATFGIKVTNNGPGTAFAVTLSDRLPLTTKGWAISGGANAGDCSIGPVNDFAVTLSDALPSTTNDSAVSNGVVEGNVLTCTFGDMGSGVSAWVDVSSGTNAADCGKLDNTATAVATNHGPVDDTGNITVDCPNINVDKTAEEAKINAGETAQFNITVTNKGVGDAFDVTLNDTLPVGLSWNEKPDTPECTITSGKLDCDIGTLAGSGGFFSVSVQAVTDAEDCGDLPNTATATVSNEPAGKDTDNSDSASITVNCPDEGCTPGFWQGGNGEWRWNVLNDQDFSPAKGNPFTHDTVFNDFFTPWSSLSGLTMLDLVSTGGTSEQARQAARMLVAAYLNATSDGVDFGFTTAELTTMWNNAVAKATAANSKDPFKDVHTELGDANNAEGGCPFSPTII